MIVDRSKVRKLKNIAVRIAVVTAAYGILYHQLVRNGKLSDLGTQFLSQFHSSINLYPLITAALLMLLNWSLEAIKWQMLISKSEPVSFFRSLKGVLTGLSVGTFTPNRWGEFAGRSFVLDKTHPLKVFFMTLIGSYSQLMATILFGTFGLSFFILHFGLITSGAFSLDVLICLFAVLTAGLLLFLYFNIDYIEKRLGPWLSRKRPKWAQQLHVVSGYSTHELSKVLLFSILRYFTFTLQFYLVLQFFQLPISLPTAAACTSVIYLIMTVIPTFALSEMGIRGSVSLFVFSLWYAGQMTEDAFSVAILSSSTILWVINLVIPAILGTFFVSHLRLFRNSKTAQT